MPVASFASRRFTESTPATWQITTEVVNPTSSAELARGMARGSENLVALASETTHTASLLLWPTAFSRKTEDIQVGSEKAGVAVRSE